MKIIIDLDMLTNDQYMFLHQTIEEYRASGVSLIIHESKNAPLVLFGPKEMYGVLVEQIPLSKIVLREDESEES